MMLIRLVLSSVYNDYPRLVEIKISFISIYPIIIALILIFLLWQFFPCKEAQNIQTIYAIHFSVKNSILWIQSYNFLLQIKGKNCNKSSCFTSKFYLQKVKIRIIITMHNSKL